MTSQRERLLGRDPRAVAAYEQRQDEQRTAPDVPPPFVVVNCDGCGKPTAVVKRTRAGEVMLNTYARSRSVVRPLPGGWAVACLRQHRAGRTHGPVRVSYEGVADAYATATGGRCFMSTLVRSTRRVARG